MSQKEVLEQKARILNLVPSPTVVQKPCQERHKNTGKKGLLHALPCTEMSLKLADFMVAAQ